MAINDSGNIALNLSTQNPSEHERVEYIGQGVLAGRENNSETKLEVDSQKRSHPDSDSVDSDTFATLVVPPPPLVLPKRIPLLSSLRALLGRSLSSVTATAAAVALLNAVFCQSFHLDWHACFGTLYWLYAEVP